MEQPLSNAEVYERKSFAGVMTKNKQERSTPYVVETAKNQQWNYTKAHDALKNGKYINRAKSLTGKTGSNKITASQIEKHIAAPKNGRSLAFLSKVPRSLYSPAGLRAMFQGLAMTLQQVGGSLNAQLLFRENDSNFPDLSTIENEIVNLVSNYLRAMDTSVDGTYNEAFINDPGSVTVRLAGDPAPPFGPQGVSAFLSVVFNIKEYPLFNVLISTGLAGGQVPMGRFYKCWMAWYIIKTFGWDYLNYKNYLTEIKAEGEKAQQEKTYKHSQYTVQQYIQLRGGLRNSDTTAVLAKTGAKIGAISNLPMMLPREEFVKEVIKLIEERPVIIQSQGGEDMARVTTFLDEDKSKRINITGFPTELNVKDTKIKEYSTTLSKYVELESFNFVGLRPNGTRVIYQVPKGLLIVADQKIVKKGDSYTIQGGQHAIATAFFALNAVKTIEDAKVKAESYKNQLTNLSKKARGGKASKSSGIDLTMNDSFTFQQFVPQQQGGVAPTQSTFVQQQPSFQPM